LDYKRSDYLTFGKPQITEDEIAEVADTLRSGWIGTGPKVRAFEEQFAEYVGARHAVAVGSCTAALHLSLIVSGIGPGDEVITTPLTFCATANAILHVGAVPVFVDIDPETMNIDIDQLEQAITPRTKAIVPVHFAGRPIDIAGLRQIANSHGLHIIEDAAHAIEAVSNGGKVGATGDSTCFSFYVTKNLTTGEGGMVTTERDDWAEKLRTYSLHGLSRDAWSRFSKSGNAHYQVMCPGYKYNMTDIQASLGLHQFARLQKNHERRAEIWDRYDDAFSDLPIQTPLSPEVGTIHARHLYTVLIDGSDVGMDRDGFRDALHTMNIGSGVHYIGLHLHPYYEQLVGCGPEDYPNATHVSERTLSLPLGAGMSDRDIDDVIGAVRAIVGRKSIGIAAPSALLTPA
jgi:dTDP-4-amino-4,6-dideoxygalactose transaminase